jgi:hypothetical protein
MKHDQLRALLGPTWRVSTARHPPQGKMRLFDFDLVLYVIDAPEGQPYKWALWDAGAGVVAQTYDVETIVEQLRVFVGEKGPVA